MTDEKKPTEAKVKVIFKRKSWRIKAGATRTLPADQAQTLIDQGHAREA